MSGTPARPRGGSQWQRRIRRLKYLRQLCGQLLGIVTVRAKSPSPKGRIFVSMMGGVGDLICLFPSVEMLKPRCDVHLGTGGYPFLAVARNNPHIAQIHTPFAYRPNRVDQRKLIKLALSPFFERVLLLDAPTDDWWKPGKHFVERYAEACGCSPPAKGALYLSDENRHAAANFLQDRGLDRFVYVAQMVRYRHPRRTWPLAHYHSLLRLIHDLVRLPIVVDTVGADETAVPDFCVDAGRLDVLTACAVIERAHLFVGSDSGLTHAAGALGTRTMAIHLGYPPETCAALGERVFLVRQRRPFDTPAATMPEEVMAAVEHSLRDER